MRIFNLSVDIIFVLDIILMFFTSFLNYKTASECKDSSLISSTFRGSFRFYTDFLSIFGASLFSNIHRYFAYFGLFKLFRVKRLGIMIASANVEENTKALMNLLKLFFYLFFFLHLIACYWWIIITLNAPERFYSNSARNGYYKFQSGDDSEPYKLDGKVVPVDPEIYITWGKYLTFGSTSWDRYTVANDTDWESLNDNWDDRSN